MIKKLFLICFLFTIFTFASAQTLKINEISICNISKELDPNYNYKGWIEFYNPTASPIDLKNIYFSDDSLQLKKYRLIKSRIIPPNGYGVIWLNNEILAAKGGYLDTDTDGGFLSISDANGNIFDSLIYGIQYTNVSFGRTIDGENSFGYFTKSSCGRSNNLVPTATEVVVTPVFSVPGGFYDAHQNVEIFTLTSKARIYYTLDGSDPDTTKLLYDGAPIVISKTTPLRAKAYASGYLEGTIATATYLLNERKPDLPVVFITADPVNLYNDSLGIYCVGTNGIKLTSSGISANYNREWVRPAHFELLDKDKKLRLSQAIGISISGNQSREFDLKSLEVKAGSKYGKSRLDYQFFPDKPAQRNKSLILRNGGQQTNPGFIIKDAFSQSFADVLNVDYQSYEPSVVYLNGLYWGILPFRERSTKDYVYSNYNYDETQIDLLEFELATNGNMLRQDTLKALTVNNDVTNDSIYQLIRKRMDIDNYCKYMATEMYVVNTDWPSNNMRRFCPKSADGKFRWVLQDLDKAFSYFSNNILDIINKSTSTDFHVKQISYLLKNEKFKQQFINTQCIVAGAVFGANRVSKRLDKFVSGIEKEHSFHAQRWDSTWTSSFSKGVTVMRNSLVTMKNKAYNDLQTNFGLTDPLPLYISSNESTAAIFFNSLEIPVLPYDGKYFVSRPLILDAPTYVNGKKFKYWSITENGIERFVDSLSFTLTISAATSVSAVYEPANMVRRAGLYINEVSAENEIFVDEDFKYEDWIELYNSSDKPIALTDYFITNNEEQSLYQFSSSQDTIPAFGYGIVWCSAKPYLSAMHTNFKLEKDGGKIVLSKQTADGIEVVDSLSYFSHTKRTSFGRCPDGSENIVRFDQATFRKRNYSSTYNELSYVQNFDLVTHVNTPKFLDSDLISISRNANQLIIENIIGSDVDIRLYTLTGMLLEHTKSNEKNINFDLSKLSSSIYLLNIQCGNEKKTIKIIR